MRYPLASRGLRSQSRRSDKPIDRAFSRRTQDHCRSERFGACRVLCQMVDDVYNLDGSEVHSRNDRNRFSCMAVDNGQKPERTAIEQCIRHKVHRRALPAISGRPERWRQARLRFGVFDLIDSPSSRHSR